MDANDLDSPARYERLDPHGLYGRIAALPDQIAQAWGAADALALPESYREIDHVVVLGMGGSGIGGLLLQALAADIGSRVPVVALRGYAVPAWAGPRTLVLASSNSGETEETVSAFGAAVDAGAKCVAISTGGRILALARERGLPELAFEWDGEPRSALGWSSVTLIAICARLGVLPDVAPQVPPALDEMRAQARTLTRDVAEASNPAKQLARRLHGRLGVFVGAQALAPVAYRWRTQVNENAKSWAIADELPEMNHNAHAGYGLPLRVVPLLRAVLLRHASMHPRIRLRVEATMAAMRDAGVEAEAVNVPGETVLAQMLCGVQLGDFVSYYLGILNDVEPSPVAALQSLKALLASKD